MAKPLLAQSLLLFPDPQPHVRFCRFVVTGQDPLNGVVAIGAECLTSGFGIVSVEPTRTILPDLSGSIGVLQPFVNSSQSTPAL